MPAGRIAIGTSGYVYPDWRGAFYPKALPQSRWLSHYAATFLSVELNATFYRLPGEAAVERWRAETPDGFAFACKGSRFLTHVRRLRETGEGVARFFSRLGRLGPKLHVVLWQLPPQMKAVDAPRLQAFLSALPRDVRHAVEFRDPAWYTSEVCDLLAAQGVAFCEHDLLDQRPERVTCGFRYLRFHGTAGRYRGRYGRARLEPVARELSRWRADGGDAFVYFNNDIGGHAVKDARELQALVG